MGFLRCCIQILKQCHLSCDAPSQPPPPPDPTPAASSAKPKPRVFHPSVEHVHRPAQLHQRSLETPYPPASSDSGDEMPAPQPGPSARTPLAPMSTHLPSSRSPTTSHSTTPSVSRPFAPDLDTRCPTPSPPRTPRPHQTPPDPAVQNDDS
jgi:hypothetical protein